MCTQNILTKSTLTKLIALHPGGIRIPMIQRDYAQGRSSWQNHRVRFLKELKKMLNNGESNHLDFIYGMRVKEDGISAFCPLDGQQRLTTLFLLHWYLAGRDGCFEKFQNAFTTDCALQKSFLSSKFTYQVRPGSRSFFRSLVENGPQIKNLINDKPATWIRQQPWFRSIWERDPSVTSALVMLDAIHEEFMGTPEIGYEQLANGDSITFHVLDLQAAGLHDDLYLLMNARGRPLTTFETFKARYEKYLESRLDHLDPCPINNISGFKHAIDGRWLDFFWDRYSAKSAKTEDTSSIDAAFINLFRAVALVSLDQAESKEIENTDKEDAVTILSKEEPDYDDFEKGKWLSKTFTQHLVSLLEALAKGPKHIEQEQEPVLDILDSRWFKSENSLLDLVTRHQGVQTLTDYLQFAACVRFLARHGPILQDEQKVMFFNWIRVVRNLVVNSNVRADTFRQILKGLDELLEGSEDIIKFLSNDSRKFTGISSEQTAEERRKVRLIQASQDWRQRIENAENHGYFRAQIDFLLEFCDADPTALDQVPAQERFDYYWLKALEMFGDSGIQQKPDFLWERAFLAIDDFFTGAGWCKKSFLVNERGDAPAWNPQSWKSLLRVNNDSRRNLKLLWDRMEKESLEAIIDTIPKDAPSWRKAMCHLPAAWGYCSKHLVRYEERQSHEPRILLLSSMRRSGAHLELFTYRLYKLENLQEKQNQDRFAPLRFLQLEQHVGAENNPHLKFELKFEDISPIFQLYCYWKNDDGFSLWTSAEKCKPTLLNILLQIGFQYENEGVHQFLVYRQELGNPLDGENFLKSVASYLQESIC